MEQILKLLAEVKIESDSAVQIVKWIVVMKTIGGVAIAAVIIFGAKSVIKAFYKIYDRIVEK